MLVTLAGLSQAPFSARADTGPAVHDIAIESFDPGRSDRITHVIDRAIAQTGVPYSWGGGGAYGPSIGIRDGGVADAHGDFEKVGFDCSGLMVFAFAGENIWLPRYSGDMLHAGTWVPIELRERGDLIFWGEDGRDHVALYLGDNMMVESPLSGGYVQVAPVRWDEIVPFVVRML
ncbi:C40 family peptidase [Hoyosella rhizosphaerae]|nr:C40 family peptidase [Hoyosella rhizosphaerae]